MEGSCRMAGSIKHATEDSPFSTHTELTTGKLQFLQLNCIPPHLSSRDVAVLVLVEDLEGLLQLLLRVSVLA